MSESSLANRSEIQKLRFTFYNFYRRVSQTGTSTLQTMGTTISTVFGSGANYSLTEMKKESSDVKKRTKHICRRSVIVWKFQAGWRVGRCAMRDGKGFCLPETHLNKILRQNSMYFVYLIIFLDQISITVIWTGSLRLTKRNITRFPLIPWEVAWICYTTYTSHLLDSYFLNSAIFPTNKYLDVEGAWTM